MTTCGAILICLTMAEKVRPGKASTVKVAFWPSLMPAMSLSSIRALISMLSRSPAMMNSVLASRPVARVWPSVMLRPTMSRRPGNGSWFAPDRPTRSAKVLPASLPWPARWRGQPGPFPRRPSPRRSMPVWLARLASASRSAACRRVSSGLGILHIGHRGHLALLQPLLALEFPLRRLERDLGHVDPRLKDRKLMFGLPQVQHRALQPGFEALDLESGRLPSPPGSHRRRARRCGRRVRPALGPSSPYR